MSKILIVDDEEGIREVIRFALEGANFNVAEAAHADDARRQIQIENPDLVLLDWMLPGRSGLELAQQLKLNPPTKNLPIIMLTARTDEQYKIRGLDVGADDYITKPFSPRELIARIKAVLRRTLPSGDDAILETYGLCVDPVSHRVSANGKVLDIAPTEYRLLHFFMTHPDRAFSRSQLLDHVWGTDAYLEERTVDVHVRRLRMILEPSGHAKYLQTVRGVGYRFSLRN